MSYIVIIFIALVLIATAYFVGENRGAKVKVAERAELEALRAEFEAKIKAKLGLK